MRTGRKQESLLSSRREGKSEELEPVKSHLRPWEGDGAANPETISGTLQEGVCK